jgi:hypothetical protein
MVTEGMIDVMSPVHFSWPLSVSEFIWSHQRKAEKEFSRGRRKVDSGPAYSNPITSRQPLPHCAACKQLCNVRVNPFPRGREFQESRDDREHNRHREPRRGPSTLQYCIVGEDWHRALGQLQKRRREKVELHCHNAALHVLAQWPPHTSANSSQLQCRSGQRVTVAALPLPSLYCILYMASQ